MIARQLTVVVVSLAVLVSACSSATTVKESSFLMGTVVEVTVQHRNTAIAGKAIKDAFNEGERIDNLLSLYKSDSETSKINLKAGIEQMEVSEDCLYVLEKAFFSVN